MQKHEEWSATLEKYTAEPKSILQSSTWLRIPPAHFASSQIPPFILFTLTRRLRLPSASTYTIPILQGRCCCAMARPLLFSSEFEHGASSILLARIPSQTEKPGPGMAARSSAQKWRAISTGPKARQVSFHNSLPANKKTTWHMVLAQLLDMWAGMMVELLAKEMVLLSINQTNKESQHTGCYIYNQKKWVERALLLCAHWRGGRALDSKGLQMTCVFVPLFTFWPLQLKEELNSAAI